MYAVNPTKRPLLISPQEVLLNVSAEGISHSKVQHAIPIAEDRFVRQLLGDDLYEALVERKNKTLAAGDLVTYQGYIDAAYANMQPYEVKEGDIINAVEHMTTADKKLWNQYLCKYVAECVMLIAFPENYTQFTEQGVIKSNPVAAVVGDDAIKNVGIDLKDMKFLMDKQLERLAPLANSLHRFICKNVSDYPLYEKCRSDCGGTSSTEQRSSSWVNLSIYKDDDE